MKRDFPLMVVLTATSGVMLTGHEGVQGLVEFMMGTGVLSNNVARATRICRPHILRQHPHLKSVTPERNRDQDYYLDWIIVQWQIFGKTVSIEPIPKRSCRRHR
jgi:hypothetical protein